MRSCSVCAISECSLRNDVRLINEYIPLPGNSFYRVTRINICIANACLLYKNRGVNRYQRTRDLLSYIKSKGKVNYHKVKDKGVKLWHTRKQKIGLEGKSHP